MRVLRYELLKLFRKKIILIALIIFSVVDVYKIQLYYREDNLINSEFRDGKSFNDGYWKAYSKAAGSITSSKINFVISRYKAAQSVVQSGNYSKEPGQPGTYTGYIFGDMNMFSSLYNALNYSYNYGRNMDRVLARAGDNIKFFTEHKNEFEVNNNRYISELYKGRSLNEFYNTDGFNEFFKYDFSSLLILLLMLLGLAPCVSEETETGMKVMLYTSKLGRKTTMFSKIAAAFIYVTAVCIYFFVLDFVCFSVTFKLYGYNLPLYAMSNYQFTPLNMSLGQFVIFNAALKLLGFIIIGELMVMLSLAFTQSIISFIASTGVITLFIAGNDFLYGRVREVLSFINPISLVSNRELFEKYSVENLFNRPVLSWIITLILMVVILCIVVVLTVSLSERDKFFRKERHYESL